MFIRKVIKKSKNSGRVIYRICTSYRTEKGPRQKTILTLKDFDLPEKDWSLLANTIQDKLRGQLTFFCPSKIDLLAEHYADLIQMKRSSEVYTISDSNIEKYETVNLGSFKHKTVKHIGSEHIGLSIFKELKLDKLFQTLGFNKNQRNLAALSIIGRLVFPGSENSTREWAKENSGLCDLLNTSFQNLSNNALYRIADKIYENKEKIENHLEETERNLLNLEEKLVLYDLTNTYFEGRLLNNPKAQFGFSKEKRKDCKLVTLGLIIDEDGFPKRSKIMKGNQSEPKSLIEMIALLENKSVLDLEQNKYSKKNKTIVVDAGIATRSNLEMIKEYGYDYVCVSRNTPIKIEDINSDNLKKIKDTKKNTLQVQLFENTDENILYCKSFLKGEKEAAMLENMKKKFEEELLYIQKGLNMKGRVKKYDKVVERIGRIKERNSVIARYYLLNIEKDGDTGNASKITWEFNDIDKLNFNFSGSYFIRTSRKDLNENELWNIYSTLSVVESAFRSLKSELAFRPIFHRKEVRTESHLFISILAYHILNVIRKKLADKDIHISWTRLNKFMSNHYLVSTSMKCINGDIILLKQTSEVNYLQNQIYKALNLDKQPLMKVLTKYKIKNL